MSDKPYHEFDNEDLILRDHLAIDRTVLANERTLLAYIRTALAFFIAGVSMVKFFDSILIIITGWLFIPVGIFTTIIGIFRYRKMEKQIRSARIGN